MSASSLANLRKFEYKLVMSNFISLAPAARLKNNVRLTDFLDVYKVTDLILRDKTTV